MEIMIKLKKMASFFSFHLSQLNSFPNSRLENDFFIATQHHANCMFHLFLLFLLFKKRFLDTVISGRLMIFVTSPHDGSVDNGVATGTTPLSVDDAIKVVATESKKVS